MSPAHALRPSALTAPDHPASSYNSHSVAPNTTSSENQTLNEAPKGEKKEQAYLLTDPLPAKLALDGMLNDGVTRRPPVDKRNGIQRDADSEEIKDLVDEITK